ncbi:hypothetical protein L9G74_20550 [Shewanella sp. C32]|uniref:Transposase n=1 Tax=Shewanella electrica TaxID=515560 RepID=A0ABT2FR36_9GAMM|nr:hypothetical protein [Shewanella electrica]MCS4558813.1 hypothetical protein [Shewanella electrica]
MPRKRPKASILRQTAGELRTRCQRLFEFGDLDELRGLTPAEDEQLVQHRTVGANHQLASI